MRIPLLDLQAQYASLRAPLLGAIGRVLDEQQFILGAEVETLEKEIAAYSQTRHAIGCASGSDALLLALQSIGVGPGDEVVTTPYSFFATASAVARLGARPVFVDIDPDTYNMNEALVAEAITDRTRALMPVHLFGQCAGMEILGQISKQRAIPIVEDAAQAIGAEDQGRRAGSMGAIGCFSFYPSKNLGGAGDGGMMVTNDGEHARQLRMLRVHGEDRKYHHSLMGINSRLDAIQAAVLRVKLPYLAEWSAARRKNAVRYGELFTDAGLLEEIGVPFVRPGVGHIFNQYVIRAGAQRDALMAHLNKNGVGSEIYYPVPLHLQECFRYLGHEEGDFPEAERAARETLALPVYPELTLAEQAYVVETVRKFYA
ncbi:MAG TPA: DegT/DnrJ/EryC1/StrS family aminotransferase [Pyrinomonadaceae bacterium]|jgi:dTDP-4-amino-4,6-dideoxygalactose transaminase